MILIFLELKILYLILLKDLPNELLQKNLVKQEKGFKAQTGFCRPLCVEQKILQVSPVSVSPSRANSNGEPQKAEVSRKWQTKFFSVFAPSADFARLQHNYFINIFFKQLSFDNYFVSSTFIFQIT